MIHLSIDDAIAIRGCLETIIAEAEEMPQTCATIIEQAEAARAILDIEISRPDAPCSLYPDDDAQ